MDFLKLPTKTETITIFPTTIQISEIANSETLNKKIIKSAYEVKKNTANTKPEAWACNLYTTIMSGQSLTDTEPFSELKKIIVDEVTKYARELRFDIDRHPLRLNECWLNIYGKGHSQDVHCHPCNVFSGIYYPKAPEGCGHLVFHSHLGEMMLEPPVIENTNLNIPQFRVVPQPGRMVIFRSWLRHSVLPTDVQDDRISIAFNMTM
jgi:uncharacterized protein (TIGR02466 family)